MTILTPPHDLDVFLSHPPVAACSVVTVLQQKVEYCSAVSGSSLFPITVTVTTEDSLLSLISSALLDCFKHMASAEFVTKLNMHRGYWQVPQTP